jgi:uncharacterized membrane protein YphA (DoxX/SURF4 family)
MSCCSSGKSSLGCCSVWLPRIGFGVMMIGFGVSHFRDLPGFIGMTQSPFTSIPALAMIAGVLAYVIPVLEIVGGILFATKQLSHVAKFCLLATFGGIMGWAGVGMMVADPSMGMMLGTAFQGASIGLIVYWVIKKMSCCGAKSCGGSCSVGTCPACGQNPCQCK